MYSGFDVERMFRLMIQRGGFDTRSGSAHSFRRPRIILPGVWELLQSCSCCSC